MATKKKELTRIREDLSEKGRDLWLAGLCALVLAEEEGTKLYDAIVQRGKEIGEESTERFNELVKKGRKVQNQSLKRVDAAVKDLEATQKKLAKRYTGQADQYMKKLEDVVEDVLERLGVPTRDEVVDLTGRVESLAQKVDSLLEVLETKGAPATGTTTEATVYHVVPQEDGWAVKKEGAERASSVHATKADAVESGRELAKGHEPSHLVIHRKDGTVQDTVNYEG